MDTKTEPQFQEVKDLTRIERIGAHSHIRGLGLNDVRFFFIHAFKHTKHALKKSSHIHTFKYYTHKLNLHLF